MLSSIATFPIYGLISINVPAFFPNSKANHLPYNLGVFYNLCTCIMNQGKV